MILIVSRPYNGITSARSEQQEWPNATRKLPNNPIRYNRVRFFQTAPIDTALRGGRSWFARSGLNSR